MTKLRSIRDELGLTQRDIATRTGMSIKSYQLYEAGKRKPSYKNLKALAEVLGTTMEELF